MHKRGKISPFEGQNGVKIAQLTTKFHLNHHKAEPPDFVMTVIIDLPVPV